MKQIDPCRSYKPDAGISSPIPKKQTAIAPVTTKRNRHLNTTSFHIFSLFTNSVLLNWLKAVCRFWRNRSSQKSKTINRSSWLYVTRLRSSCPRSPPPAIHACFFNFFPFPLPFPLTSLAFLFIGAGLPPACTAAFAASGYLDTNFCNGRTGAVEHAVRI